MNQSDILYINPSINIGGVLLSNNLSQDTIGNIYALFPQSIGVNSQDSTLSALIKTANNSGGLSTNSYAGSFISTSSDNKLVAQVIQDVSFYSTCTTYTGGTCRQLINDNVVNTLTNIYDLTEINNLNVPQFITNYFIKHVGSNITLIFIDNNTQTTDSHVLTNTSNIGVYGILTILDDGDPFLYNIQYANIFTACKYGNTFRQFTTNNLYDSNSILIPYIYILKEQNLFTSYAFPFYIDNSNTPTISCSIFNFNNTKYTSGLNVLSLNSSINFVITLTNITSEFYNNHMIDITSDFSTVTYILPIRSVISSCYNTNTGTFNFLLNIDIMNNNILPLTFTANSLTKSNSLTINCIIDCNSINESDIRCFSGTNRFSSTDYFTNYDSSVSLNNNEELMYLFGKFSYPYLDYTSYIPQGNDYSNLTGSYNNYRWFTQKINQNNLPQFINNGYVQINNISFVNNDLTSLILINQIILDIYMNENIYIVSSPIYVVDNNNIYNINDNSYNNKLTSLSNSLYNYLVYFDFKSQTQITSDIYIRIGISSIAKNKYTFTSVSLNMI